MSRHSQDPDFDPNSDPRLRRRDPRDPEAEGVNQPRGSLGGLGGLGGILGGILGGMGRGSSSRPQPQRGRFPQSEDEAPMESRHPQWEQQQQAGFSRSGGGRGGLAGMLFSNPRIGLALLFALGSVVMYFVKNQKEVNPITDRTVRVPWDPPKDVPLGLQAVPQVIAQHGGEHPDQRLQDLIDKVGMKLVQDNSKGDWAETFAYYKWDFHLLRDPEMINAFALPGGQIFFTYGLFKKLESEDEIAGVMGHEIGHVIGRHSAQQMAKHQLISGITMAGTIATSDGTQTSGQMAQTIGAMVGMKYGRKDENEADRLGVQFMANAQYNPEALIRVMQVLKAASGGKGQPEFMSTHPDPGNRIENIKEVIQAVKSGNIEGPKEPSLLLPEK